jgi:acetyl esterase/lipase
MGLTAGQRVLPSIMKILLLSFASSVIVSYAATNSQAPALPSPTKANVKYGEHERQVFDFWQADSSKATPLLIFIHGGGWRGGDKSALPPNLLEVMLQNKVSVASINYRYSEIARLPAPVHDAARAVQFIRWKAKEMNVDKSRLAAIGGSAGACTTLWLAYHDDLANPKHDDPVARESSRLSAGIGISGQTAIDPEMIVPWVGDQVLNHGMIWRAVGATNRAEIKLRYDEYRQLYYEFSPINHVSRDDPPVLLIYPTVTPLPAADAGTAIHHGMFGVKLKEKADAAGADCTLLYAEKPDYASKEAVEFLLKHLKKLTNPSP